VELQEEEITSPPPSSFGLPIQWNCYSGWIGGILIWRYRDQVMLKGREGFSFTLLTP